MPIPTAIRDRSTTDLAAVKAALGVTVSDHDALLATMLATAKQEADAYCNNPFIDDWTADDEDRVEVAIPQLVEDGLVEYVRAMWVQRLATQQLIAAALAGEVVPDPSTVATSVTTGPLAETRLFRPGAGTATGLAAGLSGVSFTDMVKLDYWSPYRLMPL